MSYKIEIEYMAGNYEYSLFKRTFLRWKKIKWDCSSIPFHNKVWEWQQQFKIPDKNIVFLTSKQTNNQIKFYINYE